MADYLPPTENLPIFDKSVFQDANDGYLTYDKAKKLFLKYPIAQGDETLQAITVAKTSTLLDNLTMSNASGAKRIIKCGDLLLDNNSGVAGSAILRIYSNGTDNYIKSLTNNNLSTMNFQLNNTSGTTITPLQLTPQATYYNNGVYAQQGLNVTGQPSTFGTVVNINAGASITGTSNYAASSVVNYNNGTVVNYLASTTLNMASSNIVQSGTISNTMGKITMLTANNIEFPSGGGIISQIVTNATDINLLKRTLVTIDNGGATGGISFETFDANAAANGRGFFFAPNLGAGSFNSAIADGDSGIIGRNIGASNNCLALSCFAADKIAIRLNARTSGTPQIISLCGANTTTMDSTRTSFGTKSTFRDSLFVANYIGHATAGNVETNALFFNATQVRCELPLAFNNSMYSTAKTSSQLGYVLTGSFAGTNKTSPTGNTDIGSISIPPGIWDIRVNISFAPLVTGTSFTICDLGLSATSATFATTGELVVGNFSSGPFTLAPSRYGNFNVSATYSNNITTGTTPVYIVFSLTFSGAVTITIGANYSITRIG